MRARGRTLPLGRTHQRFKIFLTLAADKFVKRHDVLSFEVLLRGTLQKLFHFRARLTARGLYLPDLALDDVLVEWDAENALDEVDVDLNALVDELHVETHADEALRERALLRVFIRNGDVGGREFDIELLRAGNQILLHGINPSRAAYVTPT